MKKTKILFFIHQLNSGGSQKVILNLVSNINKEKYEVGLVVINNIGEFSNFSHSNVHLIDLRTKKVRNSIFKIFNIIKTEKPDIVFSGISFLSLVFSFLIPFLRIGREIKFVARETNTLSIDNEGRKYTKILNLMYKIFYKNFDLIICQSEYMKKDLQVNYKIDDTKMVVINNPVNIEVIKTKLTQKIDKELYESRKINLLAVGRLHRDKGFDLLLNMVSKLDFNYHLTIIGQGSEENNLKELAQILGIVDRVHFLGFKSNPYLYMRKADLFILSSRHEGFPNVVLEANACGTPAIAFQCPGVTKEVIVDGINGFLVKNFDVEKMTDTIISSINYPWDKSNIQNYIHEKFCSEKIISDYEKNFLMMLKKETINE